MPLLAERVLTAYILSGSIQVVTDTIPVQIKWPRDLHAQVRRLATDRHTTFSELTRQAVVSQYHLSTPDGNSEDSDINTDATVHSETEVSNCHCGSLATLGGCNGVAEVCEFCFRLWQSSGEPELCPCNTVQDEYFNLRADAS